MTAFIPFLSLLRREIARFMKVSVQTVVTPLVSSTLYLLVFGVTLGANVKMASGLDYLAFLIPGLVTMGLINNAFQNSSSSVVTAKFSGEMEDFRVVPLSSLQLIVAMGLGAVVRGAIVGTVTFLVGSIFYYWKNGSLISVAHPLELAYFVVTGGLVFGFLGMAAAFWAKTFDQLSAVSAFILLPLTYLGGVFISIEALHPFWQSVSKLNPLLYFINGVRHAIVGQSDVPVGQSALVCLLGLVVFYAIANFAVRRGSFARW